MELKGASFLYTLAALMVTFAGFSALLLIIRQVAGANLSVLDRFLARTTIGHLMVLTAGALLPPLLALYDIPDLWIWKASAVVFGLPMLTLLLTFRRRRLASTGKPPPTIVQIAFIGLSSAATAIAMAFILGNFSHPAGAYLTALTIDFFSLAFAFITALEVVLQQQADTRQP